MLIDIDEKDLKHGLLGLVIALVEIIKEALELQAIRRMEGSGLTEAEVERLGEAHMDLGSPIEQKKSHQRVAESVKAVRDGLDNVVNEVINSFLSPNGWLEEISTCSTMSWNPNFISSSDGTCTYRAARPSDSVTSPRRTCLPGTGFLMI